MHFESLPPDYIVLDPNMTKDLTATRQPLRRLESLLTACDDLDIKPVLPPNDSSHVVALCQEIGFDLVLQSAKRVPRWACRCPRRLSLDFSGALQRVSRKKLNFHVDRHPSL